MDNLEILTFPASNFGRSIVMLAEEKGIDYSYVTARPHEAEVSAVHPLGRIPVMRHGNVKLCESTAIASYLDTLGDGAPFFPENAVDLAKVHEFASLHNTIFDKLMIRDYLFGYLFPKTEDSTPDRAFINSLLQPLQAQIAILDRACEGGWLVNGRITFADLAVFPTLAYMTLMPESGEMIKATKNLAGYIDRIAARPSAKKTEYPART